MLLTQQVFQIGKTTISVLFFSHEVLGKNLYFAVFYFGGEGEGDTGKCGVFLVVRGKREKGMG